jgi:hypothetical protein
LRNGQGGLGSEVGSLLEETSLLTGCIELSVLEVCSFETVA